MLHMQDGWQAALLFVVGLVFQLVLAGLVLLRPPKRQASTLAWILVVVMVPVIGAILFLLFGDVRMDSRRRRRHRDIVHRVRATLSEHWANTRPTLLPEAYQPIANLAYHVGETEPRGGNGLELLAETDALIDALVRDIDAAERHVHALYYIYLPDESGRKLGEALVRAAQRGVDCRLLVDAVGSNDLLGSVLRDELENGGVQVVAALPTRLRFSTGRIDLRNHRKLMVIDGLIGYTGSHNIAAAAFALKPRFAPWVDATVRIEGPAVRDLQELFIEDWYLDTSESLEELLAITPTFHEADIAVQLLGTGPSSESEALVKLIQAFFHLAREELILTTPYFVPDEGTCDALITAALRGVQVVLVVPARNDSFLVGAASRSLYAPLLDAGVRIYEYTKGLLHAKTITIDRDAALVSTANLDRRSFELNLEISLVVYDSDFASRVRFMQRSYIEDSRRIDRKDWAARAWYRRIGHNAAGVLAPIL